MLPLRLALRSGLNHSSPRSSRSPAKAIDAGLLAPPMLSWLKATDTPPMPLALMP